MPAQSILRNSLLLAVFAAICTAIIAGTWLSNRERIAEQRRAAEQRALLQIAPAARHDNELLEDTLALGPGKLGLRSEKSIYLARRDGRVVTAILPATARDGYSGDIDMIIGVNADGTVAGLRVLSHRETPGLGDKIDLSKSDWVRGFEGRSLGDPPPSRWAVKKDQGEFDQFTGATITPRAVVATVLRTLRYVGDNRQRLFGAPAPAGQEQN